MLIHYIIFSGHTIRLPFDQPDFMKIHHPSRRDFGRCVSPLPVSIILKYPKFLAYCPLVAVINEGGIAADTITFRRVPTPAENLSLPLDPDLSIYYV